MLTLWWHLMDSYWNSKVLQFFASSVNCALYFCLPAFQRIPLLLEADSTLVLLWHLSYWDNRYLHKLFRKVGKKIEVELAIKYVWHLLFNFACNFLVHWWGFSDIVIWHFIVQGLPLWVVYWFYCSDLEAWVCCRQPPGLLITQPSEFIFGEAFVSQIKTLLELKVVADGYLWNFFFFTWSRDLSKTGILNLYLSGTSLTVMCTTSCDLENLTVLESCQVVVLEDWCSLPTLETAAAFVMCQRRKTAPKAEDLLQSIVRSLAFPSFAWCCFSSVGDGTGKMLHAGAVLQGSIEIAEVKKL